MLPAWDSPYLDPVRLRAEVLAMRDSVVEALLAELGEAAFVGIYTHGSSGKAWDSPVDYVPEVSDVDVHLVLHEPDVLKRDLERCLSLGADYVGRFFRRCPDPLHVPRPQVMVINEFLAEPEFMPSPPNSSDTLFGRPIGEVRPQPDPAFARKVDIESLRRSADIGYLEQLPMHVIDRAGKYQWQVIRDLSWRVSPVGPRVLSALGATFQEAWGGNRSDVTRRLLERGQTELARCYSGFYLAGWAHFLCGSADPASGNEAVLHASRVIRLGHELGMATAL